MLSKAIIFSLILATALIAQDHPAWKSQPFSGDPLEMLKAAQTFANVDNADVQVLRNHIEVKFDANGASTLRLWRIFRVLTEDGAKDWGNVSATWQPWHEERPVLRCRAISADGAVHQIDPATIAETAAGEDSSNVLSDSKRLTAPIPAMAVGTLVEQEIVVHETRPAYDGGSMKRINFDFGAPVQWARLILEAPQTLPLRYTLAKVQESDVTKTTADGVTHIRIEQGPLEAVEDVAPMLPSLAPRYHGVSFSTGESWQKFAQRYSAAVDAQIEGADLRSWTDNLKGKREEKIAALMARLHKEIRYTGIEFGEAAIIPHKPNDVIKRKLGDCKDKSALLVALLRAAGIPAHVALLNSSGGQDILPELPGGGLFNHAIVYLPGTPEYWIDATDEFAKLGEIDADNQGRLALIASPTTTALKQIPEGTSRENRTIEQRDVFLPSFGNARIVETTEVRGAGASGFRHYYAGRDQKAIKDSLESYIKEEFNADTLIKWETAEPHHLDQAFWLRIEVDKAKRGGVYQQSAAVGFPIYRFTEALHDYFTRDPAKETNKKGEPQRGIDDEFYCRNPYSKEWRYRIHVPDGFRLMKTPESGKRQFGIVSLETEYGPLENGIITARFLFDSGKTHFSREEAEATRKAILDLSSSTKVPVIEFEQTGEALLTQGKTIEALNEFKALCARNPTSGMDRSRLARALLAAGIGEAARAEARKATEIDPKSAKAWATLGWVLQHDLIGRLRKRGFDLEGALAAYRKAKELDAEDPSRTDLAILLEYDSDGERYADLKRVKEAIDEYMAISKQTDGTNVADNILYSYAYTGRFEELKKAASEGEQTVGRRALRLVATAHLETPEAAVKECFTWTLDDATRRGVFQSAGNILLHLRSYPAAAEMMTAMARNAPNAAALLNGASIIRKSKRAEDIAIDDADPVSVTIRFLRVLLSSSKVSAKDLIEFFAKSGGLKLAEEEMEPIMREIRKPIGAADLPRKTLTDIGFAGARFTTDGDKNFVIRLKLGFSPQSQETQFLIQEEGRWKILGATGTLGPMGVLARREAMAGRVERARQLLDWAREITPAAQAEDPVQGAPFARLWERGKPAPVEEIVVAAAALASVDATDTQSLKDLREARVRLLDNTAARAPIDVALINALQKRKQWTEIDSLAARLVEDFPRSQTAFLIRLGAFLHDEKPAPARLLASARLKAFPDDPTAIRALAQIAVFEGDFKGQRAGLARLEKLGLTNASDLNSLIWGTLLDGATNAETVEQAARASQLAPNSFAVLHSAAAVLAQQGKTNEAQSTLLQAMQAAGMEEPEDNCWLVLGRIAAEVGFPDVAKARYARIPKPKAEGIEMRESSYALSRKWMAAAN